MAIIAVLGAHGKVGREVVRKLAARSDVPLAVIRREAQVAAVEADGGRPVLLDLEEATASELAAAISGAHGIIVSVGAGPGSGDERKRTVDYGAAVLAIEAAQAAGVRRLVLVSAIGVDDPLPPDADPAWTAYVEAKRDADAALRASALDWTIIRPGSLTDDEPSHEVELAETVEPGSIARSDVAEVLVCCLHEESTIGHQWEVVRGTHPIDMAVMRARVGVHGHG
ncbi:MAG: family oxidoreductase [Thermoleophilia bacterium]|nr:family oxidoreductase [Thermoleophilia bacterium]